MYDLFNPIPDQSSYSNQSQLQNNNNSIKKVHGLKYLPNFITNEEEGYLINSINNSQWLSDIRRRVQHYGYKYDYKARSIDYSMYLGSLPDWALIIGTRLFQQKFIEQVPDQLIINEYLPGQGIANHVDCEPCFGETITSISLCSTCIMDFINFKTKEKLELTLEPRSLVVVSGEARHQWTHGIPARKFDNLNGAKTERSLRISMTFRNVILNTCST